MKYPCNKCILLYICDDVCEKALNSTHPYWVNFLLADSTKICPRCKSKLKTTKIAQKKCTCCKREFDVAKNYGLGRI